MGVHENITHNRFPNQGETLGLRVVVCFHYDTQHTIKGTIVRDDMAAPYDTIIHLDDGRFVRGFECQYRPSEDQSPESGWIPVSERLPDAMESVLVQFQDGEMTVTWRAPVRRISGFVEEWIVGNPRNVVIAWQPLPKPYGGKE